MVEPWWAVLSVQGAAMVDVLIECADADTTVLAAAGQPRGGSFHAPGLNAAMQRAAEAAGLPTTRVRGSRAPKVHPTVALSLWTAALIHFTPGRFTDIIIRHFPF
jgi:hypothetical protein